MISLTTLGICALVAFIVGGILSFIPNTGKKVDRLITFLFVAGVFLGIVIMVIISNSTITSTSYIQEEQIDVKSASDIEILFTDAGFELRLRDGVEVKEYICHNAKLEFVPSDETILETGWTTYRCEFWCFYDTTKKKTYTIFLPEEYIPEEYLSKG